MKRKKMKYYFASLVLLFLFGCSHSQKREVQTDSKKDVTILKITPQKQADTTKEKKYIAIFDDITEKTTTLTNQELRIVNQNLIDAVEEYNNSLKSEINLWNIKNKSYKRDFEEEKIDLRYYFRQYFVSINKNSEKIITVVCFCTYSGNSWRSERIIVDDGGDCFLHLTINLTSNYHNKLTNNGIAQNFHKEESFLAENPKESKQENLYL